MHAKVRKVHTIVLEPRCVEDTMSIDWMQILTPLAVDVQLDCDRLAAALFDCLERDSLYRWVDWSKRALRSVAACDDVTDGDDLPIREMEARVWVSGVFYHNLALGDLWKLVVVRLSPRFIGIEEARLGRDNLPHI
jgi:hypothetical protein